MSLKAIRISRARGTATLFAALGVAAITAAGCGSGSNSGSTGGANPQGLAQAQALVNQGVKRPASVGLSKPVGKAIPAGKKLFFISCGVEACNTQGDIIKQGAADLGWTSTTIATDGSPEQLQGAFQTALRKGADAVILNAADRATLSKQIEEAKNKGVPFVTCCSTDQTGNGILYNTSTAEQNATIGKYMAAQVVADSKGKADTLYANISAFRILASLGTSFKQSYKQFCPDCGYASIDIPLTALGKDAPNRIVSYLRSHPSVDYVVLSVSDALGAGLPAALQAAGLGGKVKIIGQGAGTQIQQYIDGGQQLAAVPFDYYGVDYLMLDALARHFAGVKIPETAPPLWVVNGDNLPSSSKIFPVVPTYRSQFLKLWGKTA